jgi:hypothetical protein
VTPVRERSVLSRAELLFVGAATALTRWWFRPPAPDGFDSIDFLLGMERGLDLAKLQPHFPGYPVYVGLGAALCKLGLSPLTAATSISAAAAGLTAVGLAVCAVRLAGRKAGVAVSVLHAVAWLPLLLGSAALSDSLGTACAVLSFACLVGPSPKPGASGFAAGLLLGTRLSYWPIFISLAVFCRRSVGATPLHLRIAAGALAGTLLWAVPFFAIVGVPEFFALGTAHVRGHFAQWGGTLNTRPQLPERAIALARDLFFDGFAPSAVAVTLIVVMVASAMLVARRRHETFGARFEIGTILWVLLPYAVWVFAAQNVVEQPRHALPLVVGGLLVLGCFVSSHRGVLAGVAATALCVTLPLAWQRHTIPSAGAQAAAYVATHYSPARTAVMAGRSWRFFSELPGLYALHERGALSEVIVDLGRFDRLPENVVLTSEIDLPSGAFDSRFSPRWRVEAGPRFCVDARIDRAAPCLGLSRLVWSPGG